MSVSETSLLTRIQSAFSEPARIKFINTPKIGILLCNLGTPDATDYWSMRRYLSEFLSDRRVIEAPRGIWFFILNGLILTSRPAAKGKDYETIWNRELDESPLITTTRAQAEKLKAAIDGGLLGPNSVDVAVDWGMRYGNPSLKSAVDRLSECGCERLLLVPLYPQYSAATSATACDKIFEALSTMRRQVVLRVAAPYYNDACYIEEVSRSIKNELIALNFEPEMILASFHGMPLATMLKGDPYYEHCHKTAELIRLRLSLPQEKFMVTFQSRFGTSPWLKPYTDETVKELAANGVKRLAVITPGFSADCLETIEEIGQENAGYFLDGGGKQFARINCLNDSRGGMRVIETIVQRELQGWM